MTAGKFENRRAIFHATLSHVVGFKLPMNALIFHYRVILADGRIGARREKLNCLNQPGLASFSKEGTCLAYAEPVSSRAQLWLFGERAVRRTFARLGPKELESTAPIRSGSAHRATFKDAPICIFVMANPDYRIKKRPSHTDVEEVYRPSRRPSTVVRFRSSQASFWL